MWRRVEWAGWMGGKTVRWMSWDEVDGMGRDKMKWIKWDDATEEAG